MSVSTAGTDALRHPRGSRPRRYNGVAPQRRLGLRREDFSLRRARPNRPSPPHGNDRCRSPRLTIVVDPCRDAERLEWKRQRVGGDLRKDGFKPLAEHRGADGDRSMRPSSLHRHSNILAWTSAAALDETGDTDAVIASVNHAALQLDFSLPSRTPPGICRALHGSRRCHMPFQSRKAQAARSNMASRPRRPDFLRRNCDRIDAEVARRHVDQALAKEIRLEAPRRAIGADRRLAGHIGRNIDLDCSECGRARAETARLWPAPRRELVRI